MKFAPKICKRNVSYKDELEKLGKVECIYCEVPKSWQKYAIHVLEPVFEQFSF